MRHLHRRENKGVKYRGFSAEPHNTAVLSHILVVGMGISIMQKSIALKPARPVGAVFQKCLLFDRVI